MLRGDDPRRAELETNGWVVVARSWGAQLTRSTVNSDDLSALVAHGRRYGDVREIEEADLGAILALDASTLADYPGGMATQHSPLTEASAQPTRDRRGFGVFGTDGRALAVTFVDIDGHGAETDFTVVASEFRGLGIGTTVKAASVLALLSLGIKVFRTGGAAENAAILATNRRLGYVVDEQWVTLGPTPQLPKTTRRRP